MEKRIFFIFLKGDPDERNNEWTHFGSDQQMGYGSICHVQKGFFEPCI